MKDFIDKSLKNEDFINFLKSSEILSSKPPQEDILKIFLSQIDLKSASEDFISKFLNNELDIDLKKILDKRLEALYKKNIVPLKSMQDLLLIKNWKISKNASEEIFIICVKKVRDILIEEAKKNKTEKLNIYPSLIIFFCKLFAIGSTKINNIVEELNSLEQNFPSSNLLEIYFIILYQGQKIYPTSNSFKEHISQYIMNNAGNGALSLWFKLVLVEKNDKLMFLYENLKDEYTVKSEDFVGYPLRRDDKITLFTYLYRDREKYFTNNYILGTNYYKNSIKAITEEEITKLTLTQVMKIHNNEYEFISLFKFFVPIKEFDQLKYEEEFARLFSILEHKREIFNNLNNILIFFKQFYPNTKTKEIELFNKVKNLLLDSPLTEFETKIKAINNFKDLQEEVTKYNKLKNSIIFMEIYDISKDKYQDNEEKEHFNGSLKQFEELVKIEDNSDLNLLSKELIEIIKKALQKNRTKLFDELNLIKEYFGFKEKFDIEKISMELEKIIPETLEDKKEISKQKEVKEVKKKEKKNLKIFEDKFNECFNYYKENKKEKDDNEYYEKYINYFKEMFTDKEIQDLESNDFIDCIIKKMFILYYSVIIESTDAFINELQIIKDFFEILNIYKSVDKSLYSFSDNIKTIFPLLNERMKDREGDIFEGLKSLFSTIVENDKQKEKYFSVCFINLIMDEIKIKRINDDAKVILEFIFKNDYLIENCIPLIHYYFNDTIFSKLRNRDIKQNSTIYLKDSSLLYLDSTCKNSKLLREQLLYYFETNINKILDEKYPNNEFIQSDIIKIYITKIRAYFKEKPKDKGLNDNINSLLFISFLKVFFTKYINEVENHINLRNKYYDNFLEEENFSLTNSLSYFILKILLDIDGNFLDFLKLKHISFPKEIIGDIGKDTEKDFGFDYLIIPFDSKEANTFNDIYKRIVYCLTDSRHFENDVGILEEINSSDIDTLYCIITNLFLSKLSIDNYITREEYSIIYNWLSEKLKNNEFTQLNQYSKKIINILINMKKQKDINIKIEYNKDLINFIFAFRFILNSLSKQKGYFLFELLIDTSSTISQSQNIFEYFFSYVKEDDKNRNGIGFKLLKYIIFSHLIFAYLLGNISLEQITGLTKINFEEKNITKALTVQFKDIQKILRYYGFKNKFGIIYMNIIFNLMKNTDSMNLKNVENDTNYFNIKILGIKTGHIKQYFKIISNIGMRQRMGMNDFKKIIFEEDYDYYTKNVIKNDSYYYFTSPNFCEINDFVFQYKYSKSEFKIIDFVLSHKMDEIINKINCLSVINKVVNKLYYENNLMITKKKAMNQSINFDDEDDSIKQFNDIIPDIKKYFGIRFETITGSTKLIDLINIKGSKIFSLYESMKSIIDSFNSLLNNYKQEDEIKLDSKNIYDFTDNDKYLNISESDNMAYDRLLELIQLYSKRSRYNNDELNIYNGDKIIYDFKSIEKILVEEFLNKKKLIIYSQRDFIFSNEVFSNERSNLINDFIKKFNINTEGKKNDKISELINSLDNDDTGTVKDIYYDLQTILVFIYYNYIKSENEKMKEKMSLKEFCEKLEKYGYKKLNKILNNSEIFINDILYLYEEIETKIFEIIKNEISNDIKLKPENLKNEKKEEIKKYFEENDKLNLTEDIILNAFEKYILRYCYCDYEKDEEILNNLNAKKIFNKEDIWDKKLFNNSIFQQEMNKLLFDFNKNNSDNLEQYFLNLIFNKEEENEEEQKEKEEKEEGEDGSDSENNKDEEEEDNKSDRSKDSNNSDKS